MTKINADVSCNCPTEYILKNKNHKEVENIEGAIFRIFVLENYLQNETNGKFIIKMFSDLLFTESKIGIGRNDQTHSSDESRLYRVGMIRLKNAKILVDFEKLNLPSQGFLKLGGEGKIVSYKESDEDLSIIEPQIKDKQFKLYLATPAVFKKGWIPDLDKYKKQGIELKLLTAAIGKPIFIGGFYIDIKNRQPKPMRKAVPAGSVYYFEIEEGDMQQVIKNFHGKSVSDFETAKEGFGISYVGGIKK